MIAFGMRNYIMSDRDAVMKMPVNNAAYQLSDLTPMGQQDTCECRGAQSDLLLAAYMAGSQGFTQVVQTQDEVTDWVSGQIIQAAESWSQAQSRMRGMNQDQGRRSLLDSVEGWQSLVSGFRENNTSLATNLVNGTDASIAHLNDSLDRVVGDDRRTVGDTDPTPPSVPTPSRVASVTMENLMAPSATTPMRTSIASTTTTTPTVIPTTPSQRFTPVPAVLPTPILPVIPPRRQ